MKKNALVFAMLAAFAAAANAQTNVTVYGVVDANITHVNDGGPAGSKLQLGSGSQFGSRVGFTGTEDLGGGLSASFKLENGFNVDDGSLGQSTVNNTDPTKNVARLFGRQAWVGLNGGFGSVKLGRQNNVIFNTMIPLDPFGLGLAGDSSRLFSLYGFRTDNAIGYTAPKMGGFSGELLYGFGEVADDTTANRQIGASVAYTGGPVLVTLAHHRAENAAGTDNAKTTVIGGTYGFSVAKIHVAYAINKGVGALDTRDALIGVTVPMGAITLLASYIRKDDKAAANSDADQIGVGATYALSKRTSFYSTFARTSNDSLVKYAAGAPGATSKLFNVGVSHKF
jgi:predicted porin